MRPPLLKALILILFYEGGVGSMKTKRKTEKQNEILGQIFKPTRDVAMGCFCEEKQLHMSLYIHIKHNHWHLVGFSLQEREHGPGYKVERHSVADFTWWHMNTLTSHKDS